MVSQNKPLLPEAALIGVFYQHNREKNTTLTKNSDFCFITCELPMRYEIQNFISKVLVWR